MKLLILPDLFLGEKIVFHDADVSIPTSLSLNGRIFISLKDHLDALVRQLWYMRFIVQYVIYV